ncbi:MAG TPA: AraC family transcriptional regulator [Polyangiaceae bacterium]|nr:AraC family transcriptional regulator [Polyangiaceae bacterium]
MLVSQDVFRRLCRARDMLGDLAPHDAPSVRAVAIEVEISPFHFIRQFEALFGVTPHQFRTRARIERAQQLLSLGELSVTDICMDVGFSSLGSFSDMFARRVGASPSAYRRHVRTAVQVPGSLGQHGPRDARSEEPRLFDAAQCGCLDLIAWLPPGAWDSGSRAGA